LNSSNFFLFFALKCILESAPKEGAKEIILFVFDIFLKAHLGQAMEMFWRGIFYFLKINKINKLIKFNEQKSVYN
jgi:hypothetical protein